LDHVHAVVHRPSNTLHEFIEVAAAYSAVGD
jgi:hypothetical protein